MGGPGGGRNVAALVDLLLSVAAPSAVRAFLDLPRGARGLDRASLVISAAMAISAARAAGEDAEWPPEDMTDGRSRRAAVDAGFAGRWLWVEVWAFATEIVGLAHHVRIAEREQGTRSASGASDGDLTTLRRWAEELEGSRVVPEPRVDARFWHAITKKVGPIQFADRASLAAAIRAVIRENRRPGPRRAFHFRALAEALVGAWVFATGDEPTLSRAEIGGAGAVQVVAGPFAEFIQGVEKVVGLTILPSDWGVFREVVQQIGGEKPKKRRKAARN